MFFLRSIIRLRFFWPAHRKEKKKTNSDGECYPQFKTPAPPGARQIAANMDGEVTVKAVSDWIVVRF